MPSRASKGGKKRDFTQIAWEIVNKITCDAPTETKDGRTPRAIELSKLRASKGGRARAAKLTRERKKEIARKAIEARWKKK